MGKAFWAACVLGVAAAIGVWGYGAFSVRAQVNVEANKVKGQQRELRNWASKKDEIVNKRFIDAASRRKEALAEEEKALIDLMRSREVKIDAAAFGGKEPPRDLAEFREWMRRQYEERDKILVAAGIAFPEDRGMRGDVDRWDEIRVADFPGVLRDFVASREIYKALAEAKAKVRYTIRHTEKGVTRTETAEEERKVDALRSLRFGAEAVRDKESGPALPAGVPCSERPVSLVFLAHYNVALDVMRRLEASEKCLFVVRSVRISREADYEKIPEALRERFLDTVVHEPPAVVELGLALVEFPALRPK